MLQRDLRIFFPTRKVAGSESIAAGGVLKS